MTKEYAFRAIAGDSVEIFLNEMARMGYVLVNLQPVGRRISDTAEGTQEVVFSFAAVMERDKPEEKPKEEPVKVVS